MAPDLMSNLLGPGAASRDLREYDAEMAWQELPAPFIELIP